MPIRHIFNCGLPLYIIFPPYLKNGKILEKSSRTQNVFWFSIKLLSETFIILRRTERDIAINEQYTGLHVKYPLFLRDVNET
jgi:hypothetical protein